MGADKDKVAAVVADHLTRFWTPAMRTAIMDGHRKNLVDLSPVAARAVEKLVKPSEPSNAAARPVGGSARAIRMSNKEEERAPIAKADTFTRKHALIVGVIILVGVIWLAIAAWLGFRS